MFNEKDRDGRAIEEILAALQKNKGLTFVSFSLRDGSKTRSKVDIRRRGQNVRLVRAVEPYAELPIVVAPVCRATENLIQKPFAPRC